MATAAVNIASVATERLVSSESSKNAVRPSQGTAAPSNGINGASDDQANGVKGVDLIPDTLVPTSLPLSESTADIAEKPAEPQDNIDREPKENDKTILDYFDAYRDDLPHGVSVSIIEAFYKLVLSEEARMPLHRRIRNFKNLSFVFHAYLRLMEDR
jgi:hypothetical protein